MAKADLTADRLRELFHYAPKTGIFTRLKRVANGLAGSIAGSRHSEGYLEVSIDYEKHYLHRIAWLYVYGEMPNGFIDHINGIRDDNRIDNLRVTDYVGNAQNMTRKRNGATSKYVGVSKLGNRWRAQIAANGKYYYLGLFKTEELAVEEYNKAKAKLHWFA